MNECFLDHCCGFQKCDEEDTGRAKEQSAIILAVQTAGQALLESIFLIVPSSKLNK
jgi:hypothetical protein